MQNDMKDNLPNVGDYVDFYGAVYLVRSVNAERCTMTVEYIYTKDADRFRQYSQISQAGHM